MKKSSMTLLSLLTCTGAVCANPTAVASPIQQGVYQFTQSNQLRSYKLCTYEMCQPNSEGILATVRTSVGSAQDAIAMASDAEEDNYLVFYPQGQEGDEYARRILRKRYLVELHPDVSLKDVKERCGIQQMAPFREGSKYLICEEESAGKVLKQLDVVARDPGVKRVEPLFARQLKKDLVPNDTFYGPGGVGAGNPWGMSSDSYQWYLNNQGLNGAIADIDINVEGAWDFATGAGVMVGVVDDGVYIGDPLIPIITELTPNATGPHQNFNDGFPNATLGASFFDTHGTQVAGLISSTFNDDFGMAGSAPASNFASIRLIAGPVDDAEIASALTWGLRGSVDDLIAPDDIHIYSNSWSPGVDEPVLVQEGPLIMEALETGVTDSRGGLGAIYVFSAGNAAGIQDNSGYSSMQASQYTIAVGAIGDSGTKAGYSEPGANLVVSAPSGGGAQSVLTTTYEVGVDADGFPIRVPAYTDTFSGTSASAPLVTGVVALMLEANPGLGWRDVQDILMRTATLNNDVSGEWLFNAAGLHFHHSYGAGLVNAEAAVAAATDRIATGNMADRSPAISKTLFTGNEIIPDGDGSGVTKVFELGGDPNMRVEHVEVKLTAVTKRRGDFNITLISPSGTPSVLARNQEDNDDEESITDYVFMTTRNWGEGSAGEWLLRITDVRPNGIEGTFNDATLTVHGVLDPDAPISTGPVLISDQNIVVREGDFISYLIEARNVNEVVVGDLPLGLEYDPATGVISGIAGEAGIYTLPITLIGDDGVRNVSVSLIVRPIAGALGGAVEQVDLPTFSGGDVPWDLELLNTLDGEDAVRSGAGMQNGEESIFGFNGIPNGVVVWEWAVSSQSYSTGNPDPITGQPIRSDDRLWFNFGEAIPQQWAAFIDGERSFGREVLPLGTVAVPMTGGSNSPRWTYRKDDLYTEGRDAGFVDRVRFIDTKTYLDDVRSNGNINFDFELTSKTWWLPFEFPVGSPPSDDPAGPRGLLKTSSVGNGQTVAMAAWIEGPGVLDFRVAVSSEENDVFEFLVDGAPRVTLSGNVSFADPEGSVSYDLAEGLHYVEFRYRKDFSLDGENDFVLLDDIVYTPTSTAQNWEAGYGISLPPGDDYDGDSYSNHIEFIFGGNPTVGDIPAGLPQFASSEDGLYLEYGLDLKLKDFDLIPQQSSDLENWVNVTGATKDRTVDSVEYYRVPIGSQTGENRLYYRVLVNPKQDQ